MDFFTYGQDFFKCPQNNKKKENLSIKKRKTFSALLHRKPDEVIFAASPSRV